MLATCSPSTTLTARASSGAFTLSTCLPLRVVPRHSSSATMKPLPWWLATMNFRPPWNGNIVTMSASCSMSANWRTVAAPARQLRCLDGVEAPVGGEHQQLRGRLGEERELVLVVLLERDVRQVLEVTAQRAHPALLRHHDGDRLADHRRFFDRSLVVLGRLGEIGAPLADRRLAAVLLAQLLDLRGDRLPLLLLGLHQLFERLLLDAELLVFLADLHLLELAQIAQPHVEDRFRLHVGEIERL